MSQGWTPWYQPADLTLSTDGPAILYSLHANPYSLLARDSRGDTVFPDFSGVNFSAEASALAIGDGPTVGAARYDDFGNSGPAWNNVPNVPRYGVGFRGSAIGATFLFPAPSWNYQGESTIWGYGTAGLWTFAARHAIDDPALLWNMNPVDYPPWLASVDDVEWEHPLYPWEDSADYVGGFQFAWHAASCQFVSGGVTAHVDGSSSDATNKPWTLNMHAYNPGAFSDISFFHPHGTASSMSMYEGVAPADVDVSLSSGNFPSGFPTLPTLASIADATPTDELMNLASYGYPTVAMSYTHAGMVGGSWDYDVGDGSADAYNTQRALVSTTLNAVLRPSRVRFLVTYAEIPNLAGAASLDRRRFETKGSVV